MERLGGGAPASVEVDGFVFLKGVEDQVEVAVRKDEAAPEKRVRPVARDALEALDEGVIDEGDAELGCLCVRGGGGEGGLETERRGESNGERSSPGAQGKEDKVLNSFVPTLSRSTRLQSPI